MAETAVVEETRKNSEVTPEKQDQTLEEMVRSEQEARAEEDSTPEGKETSQEKRGHKLTAQERIRQLNTQKKDAETRATEAEKREGSITETFTKEISDLKGELARINQLVSAGRMTGPEAKEAKAAAETSFDSAIDALDIPEELMPFKDDLVKIARTISESIVKAQIGPIAEKLRVAEQEKTDKEVTEFREGLMNTYKKLSDEYSDLFAEAGKDGFKDLKPEYQAEALEFIKDFNVRVDKGRFHNPMLASEKGIRTMLEHLNRRSEASKTAEERIRKINRLKSSDVEIPDSRKQSSPKGQSLEDIIKQVQKDLGG